MTYILYKNPVQLDTLAVVQYLHFMGHTDLLPQSIFERCFPGEISQLPAVYDTRDHRLYLGIDEVISFFETRSRVTDLLRKALEFKHQNPHYRVGV
jgi:hypothetical protein